MLCKARKNYILLHIILNEWKVENVFVFYSIIIIKSNHAKDCYFVIDLY